MTMEQYSALVELMPQIETALEKQGEKIPRPNYETTARDAPAEDQGEEQDEGSEAEEDSRKAKSKNGKRRKANIEATSDEDEDD
jgi:hypothetical protein